MSRYGDGSRETALMIGGYTNPGTVEKFDKSKQEWDKMSTTDTVKQLSDFTAVTLNYIVYIFGGYYKGQSKPTDRAHYMTDQFQFETLSQRMASPRYAFASIPVQTWQSRSIYHFGGFDKQKVEVWKMEKSGQFEIMTIDPTMDNWSKMPLIFQVDKDEFVWYRDAELVYFGIKQTKILTCYFELHL